VKVAEDMRQFWIIREGPSGDDLYCRDVGKSFVYSGYCRDVGKSFVYKTVSEI
jgi:hypothetical protein